MFDDLNSFSRKRVTVKSNDFISLTLLREKHSKPYNKIGRHLLFSLPVRVWPFWGSSTNFPQNGINRSVKWLFGMVNGASKFPALRDMKPQIPYFFYPWQFMAISCSYTSTYCITSWSNSNTLYSKIFLIDIRISNQQSSRWHASNRRCNSVMEKVTSNISSA